MKECEFTIDFKAVLSYLGDLVNYFNNHKMFNHPVNIIGQFFEYKLDETMVVTADMMISGEVLVYFAYRRTDNTSSKIEIGTLSSGLVIQDPTLTWPEVAQYAFWHKDWPDCLAALNKVCEVAIIMLT
jgi:hypothetical protein